MIHESEPISCSQPSIDFEYAVYAALATGGVRLPDGPASSEHRVMDRSLRCHSICLAFEAALGVL